MRISQRILSALAHWHGPLHLLLRAILSGVELMKKGIRLLALSILLTYCAYAKVADPEAALGSPVFVTIDFPAATGTRAYGINNSGRIVGSYDGPNGTVTHAFLYYHGLMHKIDPPVTGGFAEAYGINNQGAIVGSDLRQGFQEGFLYRDGTYLNLPLGGISLSDGLNDSGLIVGASAPFCCDLKGYLYNPKNKRFFPIDIPGSIRTFADSINSSNVIVGSWEDASQLSHGWIRQSGVTNTLDAPGAFGTVLLSINSAGTIAGWTKDSAGIHHGLIVHDGVFRNVDFPGAAETYISGVNDFGMIVGLYIDANGVQHGFFGHL